MAETLSVPATRTTPASLSEELVAGFEISEVRLKLSIQNRTHGTTPEWDSPPQSPADDAARLLEELACSGEVAGKNMAMQNAVSYQQAFQQLSITGIGKCFQMITQMDPSSHEDAARIEACQDLMKQLHQMAQDLGPNTPAHHHA